MRGLSHGPRLLLRRCAGEVAPSADARPRNQRQGGGRRRGGAGVAGESGDRPRGHPLRRMRAVRLGTRHHLPSAADAGQRHPGGLRHPHPRSGTGPLSRGRETARGGRPYASRRLRGGRRGHHPVPGRGAGGGPARRFRGRGGRRRSGRIRGADRTRLRRDRGGPRCGPDETRRHGRERRRVDRQRPRGPGPRPQEGDPGVREEERLPATPAGRSSSAPGPPPGRTPPSDCSTTARRCRSSASPWTRWRFASRT